MYVVFECVAIVGSGQTSYKPINFREKFGDGNFSLALYKHENFA